VPRAAERQRLWWRLTAAIPQPAAGWNVPLAHVPSTTMPLLLDLLEWLDAAPRGYAETMEAWRTSCPRLPVWEEAAERGFLHRGRSSDGAAIFISDAGRAFLREHRR
jgi:D-3-phosphoglycerate dehydrogenase